MGDSFVNDSTYTRSSVSLESSSLNGPKVKDSRGLHSASLRIIDRPATTSTCIYCFPDPAGPPSREFAKKAIVIASWRDARVAVFRLDFIRAASRAWFTLLLLSPTSIANLRKKAFVRILPFLGATVVNQNMF